MWSVLLPNVIVHLSPKNIENRRAVAADIAKAPHDAFVLRTSGAESFWECSLLHSASASYIIERWGFFLIRAAYINIKVIITAFKTNQQIVLYSIPENICSPAIFWATPIVKGLSIAPANPTCAATYTIATPVMESYPIDMASGIIRTVKAIVSSLIPKTAPKVENNNIIKVRMMLFTPIFLKRENRSRRDVNFKNE